MNKYILLFLFFVFNYTNVNSQNYTWANSLAGKGVSTLTNLNPGSSLCSGVAVDNMDNVYITGFCNDSVDFDPGPANYFLVGGNDDIFFAKYNPSGNFIWAKVLKSDGRNWATDIVLDSNNNIYLTGQCQSNADFDPGPGMSVLTVNPGYANIFFIAKYDSSGNYIWAKGIGGAFATYSTDLSIDNKSNIYVTGSFYNTVDFDPGNNTQNLISNGKGVFFAKYDLNGDYIWAKNLSGVGSYGGGSAIEVNDSGNVFITGYFGNTVDFDPSLVTKNITANTTADRFFAKYDNFGNFIWAKNIDVNDNGVFFTGRNIKIAIDQMENVIITGDFKGNVDFDPGPGQVFLSSSYSSTYISKYDMFGNFLWTKGIIGSCISSDIKLDCNEYIYITGSFYSADFNPGQGVDILTSNSPSAFMTFFAKYDTNGYYNWAKMIGNNGYGGSTSNPKLTIKLGNQFIGGIFKQTGDFDPSSNNATLTASGVGQNAFFAKYSSQNIIDLGNDTILCEGETLILDATTLNATYLWQDNSTNPTFNVQQQGSYWVQVTDNCGSVTDTINVSYYPVLNLKLGNDTTLCQGEPLRLDATTSNATYLWQDNSTNPTFNITQQGTYWVQVTNNCENSTDTINVTYNPRPSVDLGNDTALCQGETLTINAANLNAIYLWQDSSINPTFIVTQHGNYWVQVTNSCGSINDTIIIIEEDCEIILEMPNIFTPNNDGVNDLFIPIKRDNITSIKTNIYNRWGMLIFASDFLNIGWDGRTTAGSSVANGTYYWTIQYTDINGVDNNLKGYVTVLR